MLNFFLLQILVKVERKIRRVKLKQSIYIYILNICNYNYYAIRKWIKYCIIIEKMKIEF
jgi:hypothetical protein